MFFSDWRFATIGFPAGSLLRSLMFITQKIYMKTLMARLVNLQISEKLVELQIVSKDVK